MKRARTASALVLALGMAGALTACSQDSEDATESAPTTATTSETVTAYLAELGPDGIGSLTLGMDREQAEASGILKPFVGEPNVGCSRSQLAGAPGNATPAAPELGSGIVTLSSTLGVATIDAHPGVMTPEGIGIGSPVTAVDTAYPDWTPATTSSVATRRCPGTTEPSTASRSTTPAR
jgi:hypothetical protein